AVAGELVLDPVTVLREARAGAGQFLGQLERATLCVRGMLVEHTRPPVICVDLRASQVVGVLHDQRGVPVGVDQREPYTLLQAQAPERPGYPLVGIEWIDAGGAGGEPAVPSHPALDQAGLFTHGEKLPASRTSLRNPELFGGCRSGGAPSGDR